MSMQVNYGVIEDGFGSVWERCGADCDIQVVRPGKCQCNEEAESCPNRRPQVTAEHIHESNLIEGIDDMCADADLMGAWRGLEWDRITPVSILRAQALVVAHQNDPTLPGWRSCRVWVAGREGAPWPQVPTLVDEWCTHYQTMTPIEAHVAFETIHPFRDGNGRTGRLLLWHHEISQGLEPTLLRASRRHDYYDWFRT